jgi:hypothetical protein
MSNQNADDVPETILPDVSAVAAAAAAMVHMDASVEFNVKADNNGTIIVKVEDDKTNVIEPSCTTYATADSQSLTENDRTSLAASSIPNTTSAIIATSFSQEDKGSNHVFVDTQAKTTTTITTTMTPARMKLKPNTDSKSGIKDFVPLTMYLWIIVPEEKDVITGRGKRAGAWPGNIYFRQMVNRYRDAYHKSVRSVKCQIAQQVVDAIHANGGRFLDEAIVVVNNDTTIEENQQQQKKQPALERRGWILMDPPKILEKTCQALREKIKAKTPLDINPFIGKEAVQKMIAQNNARDERKRQLQNKITLMKSLGIPYHSNKYQFSKSGGATSDTVFKLVKPRTTSTISLKRKASDMETNDSTTTATITTADIATLVSKPSIKKPRQGLESTAATTSARPSEPPVPPLTFPSADIMLKKLETFRKNHGHLIVPIEWSEDIVLADWCTYMRQLYREVRAGYRSERHDPHDQKDDENNKGDSTKPPQEQIDKTTCVADNNSEVKIGAESNPAAAAAATNGVDQGTKENPEATAKSDDATPKVSESVVITKDHHSDVLSVEQQGLLDLLQVMGFCWDYEEWHWNYQFLKLQENPALVREWVREMRSEYQRGRLDPYRVDKLQSERVLLW